jgi:RNA polymerase sigma factor (sigma-70 family)
VFVSTDPPVVRLVPVMDDTGPVGTQPPPTTAGTSQPDEAHDPIEALFRSDYARLVGLARLLLDHQVDAEEVVQETFARLLSQRRGPAPGALAAYVERSVVNVCRDGLRRRAVIRRVALPAGPDARAAEVVALGTAEQQRLVEAVRGLPRRQRECVALRHLLGRSTTETAAVLGIGEGSVKTHLSRGMAALEAQMEEWR